MKKLLYGLLGVFFLFAKVAAVEIKASAPSVYVVKEGDTLWQIAGLYLEKPWHWPFLWQQNSQIKNPHLIYPGDKLTLTRDADGKLGLQMSRNKKRQLTLSPQAKKTLKSPEPVPLMPWSSIKMHVRDDLIMQQEEYQSYPYLLGDQDGAVRFAHTDLVLGKQSASEATLFHVVRLRDEIVNADGESLGFFVKSVAKAQRIPSDIDTETLVKILDANLEVKPGDRLVPMAPMTTDKNMRLQPALTQRGTILASLQDRALLGKYDTVVVDLGALEVSAGVVMGIYLQGPAILDAQPLRYESSAKDTITFFDDDRIEQPALKVGELLIFKTFEQVSYAVITASTNVIRVGAVAAKP